MIADYARFPDPHVYIDPAVERSRQSLHGHYALSILSLFYAGLSFWAARGMDSTSGYACFASSFTLALLQQIVTYQAHAHLRTFGSTAEDARSLSSWHRITYKQTVSFAMLQTVLFFVTLFTLVFHSRGLQFWGCIFYTSCTGTLPYHTSKL